MMTKSDFQMVADTFKVQTDNLRTVKAALRDIGAFDSVTGPKRVTLETSVYDLAQRFHAQNPRFNHKTFYEACGMTLGHDNWPKVFPNEV